MTDADAILAAICDRPDDDTPRLVYADYLDDHGQSDRAELIRVMCRRRELSGGAAGAATRRPQKILGAGPAWLLPGADYAPVRVHSRPPELVTLGTTTSPVGRPAGVILWWERGFVTKASFASQTLGVVLLPGLLAEHPIDRAELGNYWVVQTHQSVAAGWACTSHRPYRPDSPNVRVQTLSRPTRGELLAALPAFLRAELDAIAQEAA